MSKRKFAVLMLLSGSYLLALGLNCLPNIGASVPSLTAFFQQLFGTA